MPLTTPIMVTATGNHYLNMCHPHETIPRLVFRPYRFSDVFPFSHAIYRSAIPIAFGVSLSSILHTIPLYPRLIPIDIPYASYPQPAGINPWSCLSFIVLFDTRNLLYLVLYPPFYPPPYSPSTHSYTPHQSTSHRTLLLVSTECGHFFSPPLFHKQLFVTRISRDTRNLLYL